MTAVTETHEQKETFQLDIFLPGHEKRATTSLFTNSRKQLIAREKGHCYICGETEITSGNPLEAHHHPIERSLANMIDWDLVKTQCLSGVWGDPAKSFDW